MPDSDVKVPKVGSVPKKPLIAIVVIAGGFVGYRYYQSRNAIGGDESDDAGYEDGGVLPSVQGAVRDDNAYGSGSQPPSTEDFGFTGHTNDEWTQYVSVQLSQGDKWPYGDIVTALGAYLAGVPLTTAQQDIARAAVAVGGYPPVGSHPIIGGGNVAVTVAPGGVHGTPTTTAIKVYFNGVAGAASYNAYLSGGGVFSAGSAPVTITGLSPGRSYSVQVAAVSASGQVGPKSAAVTIKTPAATLAKCAKPTVTSVTASSAHITTKPVAFATSYQWFLNGRMLAATDNPTWTTSRQKPKTRYSIRVRADSNTGSPGPLSDTTYYTTK